MRVPAIIRVHLLPSARTPARPQWLSASSSSSGGRLALAMASLCLRQLLLATLCVAASVLGAQATGGGDDARTKGVGVYELRMGDFSVKVTNWGARLVSVRAILFLPPVAYDRLVFRWNLADVVLGKDTIAEYVNDTSYFGPITGRVGQRISGGRFVLDGKFYHLERNDGRNTIHAQRIALLRNNNNTVHDRWNDYHLDMLQHLFVYSGGGTAFSKSAWTVKEYVAGGDSPHITMCYHSFDGEQGFPGSLDAYVTYAVSSPYTLAVHMNATALDKATPVNLLQHVYWNLGGHGSGDVLGHTLRLFASRYAVLDAELLPSSGRLAPVAGTPLDFRSPTAIGARIRHVMGGKVVGYDANYIIDGDQGTMRPVALVQDSVSGRKVELWANQATMQLYTGNWLNHTKGKDGKVYNQYAGFTLETMGYVDAVNHPEFPSQTLLPGQEYKHDMVFKFSF
ncbi:hypothetical protein HU200_027492 [Digitaria exilis]|uniref:Aldose 1-epimerase n=1 Tax=Digitaria exilis TaxID=1010633 RepID=A0A835C7H7_9POAL|nr:hypothetical protein HU200_027492 [Digitaria exilis]